MKKILVLSVFTALGAALIAAPSASAQTVRLHVATTLAKLITDQKAALEGQAAVKLEVVGNGAGRGLADLAAGQTVSGQMKAAASSAAQPRKPGLLRTARPASAMTERQPVTMAGDFKDF